MSEKYGTYVRLWGLEPSQLPSADASPQDLIPLLQAIFQEAIPFIHDVPTASPSRNASEWKSLGIKKYTNSTAPVQLYERVVSAELLCPVVEEHHPPGIHANKVLPEKWVLRRSVHEDSQATGTACWNEWLQSFKDNHAEAERDFTATVLATSLRKQWDCSRIELELQGQTWINWTLKLEESVHKLPSPLKNRVFPVLQATASIRDRQEFMVVQIAVRDANACSRNKNTVLGAYTSVERLRETADGIEWVMGTASDAKGVLPAWMQHMAVPGKIAKDVDMFLAWIATERKKSTLQSEPTNAASNS